jgi:hypothetical protein
MTTTREEPNVTTTPFSPQDIVFLKDDLDRDYPLFVVQVGSSENVPAPDVRMVLVKPEGSRSSLRWEYAEDFQKPTYVGASHWAAWLRELW